jgi:hypothetical protein
VYSWANSVKGNNIGWTKQEAQPTEHWLRQIVNHAKTHPKPLQCQAENYCS